MGNFNKVLLMGNLTRDPAMTYLPSNTPVTEIGLAVNRKWTGSDGQAKEEVTFVDCIAFAKQAEVLAKYKKKGDPLFIEGRLKLDQWQAQDGTNRSKLRVVIENFQFIDRRGGDEQAGEPEPPAPQAAPARQPAGQTQAAARPAPARQPARPSPVARPAPVANEHPSQQGDDIPF